MGSNPSAKRLGYDLDVNAGSSPAQSTMYYIKKKKSDKPKKRQASQATLVKKLDKVFSQYIRLRDAFPNGTFRCISCGKIKPFASTRRIAIANVDFAIDFQPTTSSDIVLT